MRRVRLAVGLGLALVGITVLVTLVTPTERDTGSNTRVSVSGVEVLIPPTRTRCQRETVPANSDRARVFARALGPAGPVKLLVRSRGRTVAQGRIESIRSRGPITVRLRPRTARDVENARVCFDNDGVRSVMMAGNQTPPVGSGNLGAEFPPDQVRVDYMRSGESTWWRLAPTIADRFARLKSDVVDPFWLYGLAVVVAAAWAGALVTLRRGLRS